MPPERLTTYLKDTITTKARHEFEIQFSYKNKN